MAPVLLRAGHLARQSKLTLNYGLRADIYSPQTVNDAGNGGWLDINTGEIRVGGVGDVDLAGNVKNKINWAPRLGAAYQINQKMVIRAGYGRSYDTGVFGSHLRPRRDAEPARARGAGAEPGQQLRHVFNLAQGPSAPVFPTVGANGRFPLPNGDLRAPPARHDARASRRRLERHAPARAHAHDLRRDRLRRQPRRRLLR